MPKRGLVQNHCKDCKLYLPLCICAQIPSVSTQVRVCVIMHRRELALPSNTARLAHRCLPNSEILLRGLKDNPLNLSSYSFNANNSVVLFPSSDSVELSDEWLEKNDRPQYLLVPDGNWGQGQKMLKREKVLSNIPRVKIVPRKSSEYKLRKSPHFQNLCTFEAIMEALRILEGEDSQQSLQKIFTLMIQNVLKARQGV